MAKYRSRTISQCIEHDADRLLSRQKKCADFKSSIKSTCGTARRFAILSGSPERTIYVWTSRTRRCIPPPEIAERFVWILNNFPEVAAALEKEFIRDGD